MRRKCSNITFCHFYIHIHVHVPSQCFCYFCFCCSFVYLFCCCCCYYCCLFQLCTYHMNLLYTCYEGTLCLFSLFVCLFWGVLWDTLLLTVKWKVIIGILELINCLSLAILANLVEFRCEKGHFLFIPLDQSDTLQLN